VYDLNHYVGGDLVLSDTGDLALVTGTVMGQQRVLRRLLTNPAEQDVAGNVTSTGDYLWHQDYGAGAGKLVGQNANVAEVTALVRGQMLLEAAVAHIPEPVISVAPIDQGVGVNVQYTDAASGTPQFLSFDVNK
jgi:hypothetical protein